MCINDGFIPKHLQVDEIIHKAHSFIHKINKFTHNSHDYIHIIAGYYPHFSLQKA